MDSNSRRKLAQPIDNYVGQRVRVRRQMLSMSQEKLGDGLGLSFQQVQKYEKGTNRISASRLQQIADILGVPASFFFEGAPGAHSQSDRRSETPGADHVTRFLSLPEGLALAKAFVRLKDKGITRRIIALVEQIVST